MASEAAHVFQEDPADESKPEREEGELVSDDTKQQKRQEHEAAEAERQVRAADPAPFLSGTSHA